jgi:uncharacterized protein (TIGR00730 family)
MERGALSRSVCVYCGSYATVPDSYLEVAAAVGTGIAARGWTLVWGGGRTSMMGAVAMAARAGGARTVGVIPQALVDREWADHDADELHVVGSMRERKATMEDKADAFLSLPGGLGTCEELFEIWTAGYLSLHAKPVVLLDVDEHWAGLLRWVTQLRDKGFVSDEAIGRLTVTTTVDEALAACAPVS